MMGGGKIPNSEPADVVLEDLKEMHHKTFKKKYDLTKDEYRAKHNIQRNK